MASRLITFLQSKAHLYVSVVYGSTAAGSLFCINDSIQINKKSNSDIANNIFDATSYGMLGGIIGCVAGIASPIWVPLTAASCVIYGANLAYDKFAEINKVE